MTKKALLFSASSNPAPSALSSAGVFNSSNQLVRTIWSAQNNDPRVSNPAAAWDGTLDDGSVAPTGTYTIGLVSSFCSYTWDGVAGNTCPDHYKPANYAQKFTYISGTTPIWSMAITNANDVYYVNNYHEKNSTIYFTTTADMQHAFDPVKWPNYPFNSNVVGTWSQANNVMYICTDGINIYFVNNSAPSTVKGVVGSTHLQIMYSAGDSFGNIGTYPHSDGHGFVTSITAQHGGTGFVFVARPSGNGTGELMCLDEVTGAIKYNITTYPNCFTVACSPTTGELWLMYQPSGHPKCDTIEKFTVNPSTGALTTTGVTITLSSLPQASQGSPCLAISPDGSMLLVIDAGFSANFVGNNQVIAYNTSDGSVKAAWANAGRLGQAGGYVSSPTVTDNKFMFSTAFAGLGGSNGGYICFAPDGSFWLGDQGNYRNLHFSAGNSPTVIERTAYVPTTYSVQVCRGDNTRLFGAASEWSVDYTKPWTPTGGGWTLVNNWAYGLTDVDHLGDNAFALLGDVGVYSNGRTYFRNRNDTTGKDDIYELTATGARNTGVAISNRVHSDFNFNLYTIDDHYSATNGGGGSLYKLAFTGFDVSNNPTWAGNPLFDGTSFPPAQGGWTVVITTTTNLPNYATGFEVFQVPTAPLANGVVINNQPRPALNRLSPYVAPFFVYHIAGFDSTTGNWRFFAGPEAPPLQGQPGNFLMYYPPAPYNPSGDGLSTNNGWGSFIYKPGAIDFFSCYRGELFENGQTNMWCHYHQSGLLIGRFGCVSGYYGAPPNVQPEYFSQGTIWGGTGPGDFHWGDPGHAGNVASGGVAYVDADNAYIFHGEEWVHSGLHRWHIANYSSIHFTTVATVNWNSGSYVPPSTTGSNMLVGLPFYSTNVPNNSGGWVRSPTANLGTWPGTDLDGTGNGSTDWVVATNWIEPNPRNTPDLLFYASMPQSAALQPVSLSKSIPRTNTSNWTMLITLSDGGSDGNLLQTIFVPIGGPINYAGAWLEIVDPGGKRIVSLFAGNYVNQYLPPSQRGGNSVWVNQDYTTLGVVPMRFTANPANYAPLTDLYSWGLFIAGGYKTPADFTGSQYTRLPSITVSADVNSGLITVSHGPNENGLSPSITVPVMDAGADIVHPDKFQINFRFLTNTSGASRFVVTKLLFTEP